MTTQDKASAITVSLEWAKKLKEAGWSQDEETASVFWWSHVVRAATGEWSWKVNSSKGGHGTFAAPTAEEILRRLPMDNVICGKYGMLNYPNAGDAYASHWFCKHYKNMVNGEMKDTHEEKGITLANASAAMWCYLSENNLLQKL